LHHHHNVTLALLTGIMVGSLNKVWPWKQTMTSRMNSHGEWVPLVQQNLLPADFLARTGQDPQLVISVGLMLFAMLMVLGMEWIAYLSRHQQVAGRPDAG
jgi:putative membrane protein